MATPATITSEQTLEAQVAGPGGATRIIIVTGIANCGLGVSMPSPAGGTATQQGSFEAFVGPASQPRTVPPGRVSAQSPR